MRGANATFKPVLAFARVVVADRWRRTRHCAAPERHLLAAEAWLCRAHDATPDGGVSYGYALRGGWRPSYPETSGYIATTFYRLARDRGDPACAQRAQRIVRWLRDVQNADGSFANPRYGAGGIVFDTGQVLFGLVRGWRESGDAAILDAARRAAGWLVRVADADLRWTRHEHLDTPHVYNTRSAWALLQLDAIEPDAARTAVARSNLDWALECQRANGFFEHCAFTPGRAPFTHTIAYTARGLLEAGLLLNEPRYVEAAARCAAAVQRHLSADGHLPGMIATDGARAAASCCLTGNCQFAIVWARLHAHGIDAVGHRAAALRALDYVMATQDLDTPDADVRGAIKGSHPVWGRYACLSYPNWATKFFIDAMWLRRGLE